MTWLPLESKMFTSVSYDADKQILYLRFRKTGDVYRYFAFPATEYQAFLHTESKGRFFLAHIRDQRPACMNVVAEPPEAKPKFPKPKTGPGTRLDYLFDEMGGVHQNEEAALWRIVLAKALDET